MSNWQADHMPSGPIDSHLARAALLASNQDGRLIPSQQEQKGTHTGPLSYAPPSPPRRRRILSSRKMPRRRKAEITENGKICTPADFRFRTAITPLVADIRTVYSPTAFCRAFWIHGTYILPKLAVFEYMPAICCHQRGVFAARGPFGNTPR